MSTVLTVIRAQEKIIDKEVNNSRLLRVALNLWWR